MREAAPRYALQVVWECGSRQTLLAWRYNALRAFLRTRPTWRHAVITRGTHTILVVV